MLNLASNLARSAFVTPEKVAIKFADKSFTYAQLEALSSQIANGLKSIGIGPGDKVALGCPNLPYFPMVYYAILKAGAVVVPLNVLLKGREIAYHLQDSEAKAYLCFEGSEALPMGEMGWEGFNQSEGCEHFFMITADPAAAAKIEGVKTLGALIHGQQATTETCETAADDTAVILYTSGTTGKPKGAELAHSNIAMNTFVSQALLRINADDNLLIVLPMFHSFGQVVQMNTSLLVGATMVLIPRFEPNTVLTALQQEKITIFAGVPTMYIGLLSVADQSEAIAGIGKQLRVAVSGGASMPVEVLRQFSDKFDVPILEGYGLSETSPVATFNHLEYKRIPGSVGRPVAGIEVCIMDEHGNQLATGNEGEVAIRGHNIMKGYYNRPEETAEAMHNSWFRTGDIGKLDEQGYLYIVDRVKDMIIRGGFNVYPREVEETMMEHSEVAMVAVIGTPHETHGEEIKAFVVPTPTADKDETSMRAWCKERMADYKYPREISFVDNLPMSATGKILKRELR
ncbi:MAG: long-chain fatty acid--CoA ligase [Candidatus Sedimenticola sp. (ex Thyasira tokunagai)]